MNTPNQQYIDTSNSDFKKYFRIVVRNWYWFVISLGFSVGFAKVVNVLTMRTYKISCELTVGEKDNAITDVIPGPNQNIIDFNKANPINKEIGVLKSKNLAEQTIAELDFNISYYEFTRGRLVKRRRYYELPFRISIEENDYLPEGKELKLRFINEKEVDVYIDDFDGSTKKVQIGEKYVHHDISFRINYNNHYPDDISNAIGKQYQFFNNKKIDIVNEFWHKMNVAISPTSQNILVLSLVAENSNMAIVYLDKLCELYDENDLQLRNRMATNTISYIEGQLGLLNDQLTAAADSLIKFKQEHKVVQLEASGYVPDELIELDKTLQLYQYQLQSINEIQAKLDTILTGGHTLLPMITGESINHITEGLENINKLVLEKEILLKNQKKNSPAIIRIDQQIQVEVRAFQSYLEQSKIKLTKETISLKKQRTSKEAELLNLPTVERQLAKLNRDFELTENLYNLYQQKRIEAKLAEASTVSNVRMLNPPSSESLQYITPNAGQNIKMAILFGLAFPLLIIILFELLTNRVRHILDISNVIDLPIVGKITHSRANINLPTKEFPWAAITESFRTLHARLKYMLPDDDQKIVAITSGSSGEGKTFCAMNLATIIAASGKKVLLIGLDLRRPKIHEVFDLDNTTGLTTYLIGNNTKDEIITETFQKNLYLANSGPIPPNPVELIEHTRMTKFLKVCRKEFDFIIIDSPPIGLVADALLISKMVDLYLFVIRMDYTKKNITDLLRDMIETNSLKQLSMVFNDIKEQERYGYGYGYYNSYYQKEEVTPIKRKFRKLISRKR